MPTLPTLMYRFAVDDRVGMTPDRRLATDRFLEWLEPTLKRNQNPDVLFYAYRPKDPSDTYDYSKFPYKSTSITEWRNKLENEHADAFLYFLPRHPQRHHRKSR